MPDRFYYLTPDDLRHYKYMLAHGYAHKIVQLASQRYLIFGVTDKPRIGIAWPVCDSKLEHVPDNNMIFQNYETLQNLLMPSLAGSTIKVLLFPRAS